MQTLTSVPVPHDATEAHIDALFQDGECPACGATLAWDGDNLTIASLFDAA